MSKPLATATLSGLYASDDAAIRLESETIGAATRYRWNGHNGNHRGGWTSLHMTADDAIAAARRCPMIREIAIAGQ